MIKEQRKAIENLSEINNLSKEELQNENITAILDYEDLKSLDTVLSLIKEQQEEMQQKDKQIDLMAKFIENNMSEKKIINEICIKSKCNNEECHEDDLKDCIKQYFERKVEDVKD